MDGHFPELDEFKARSDNHSMGKTWASRNSHFIMPFPNGDQWNCLDGEGEVDLHADHIKAIHYTYMATQPQLPYALKRMNAAGLNHWFDGQVKPHWRTDLIELFDELLAEAAENGYPVERYTRGEPYGNYQKHSVATIGIPGWAPDSAKEQLRR
jgi:hypothetical protein